jgi:hypothetical protein
MRRHHIEARAARQVTPARQLMSEAARRNCGQATISKTRSRPRCSPRGQYRRRCGQGAAPVPSTSASTGSSPASGSGSPAGGLSRRHPQPSHVGAASAPRPCPDAAAAFTCTHWRPRNQSAGRASTPDPASGAGLTLGLIRTQPPPFTGGRAPRIGPGHGRWRLSVNAG